MKMRISRPMQFPGLPTVGRFFRPVGTCAIAVGLSLVLAGCVTTSFPRGKSAAVSPKKVGNDIGSILAASTSLDSRPGAKLLKAKGFKNPVDAGLRKQIAGRTIFIGDAAIYFTSKGEAIIDDRGGAKKLKSKGRWTIRDGRVCHSVRQGHEFCTGVFMRKDETLCWPGMGTWADDTGFLSRCVIFKGNGTKGQRPAVAQLAKATGGAKAPGGTKAAGGSRNELSGLLTSARLAEIATGNTLKIGRSLIYYGPTGVVRARDFT